MISGAVIGVACFVLFAILHLGLPHLGAAANRGVLSLKAAPICMVVIAALVVANVSVDAEFAPVGLGRAVVAIIWGELAFLGLLVLYMPFIYTLTHSLSVETLLLLDQCENGRLPEVRLSEIFAAPDFLYERLNSMVESSYLIVSGSRYRLTPRARALAAGFRWLKSSWRLGPGG